MPHHRSTLIKNSRSYIEDSDDDLGNARAPPVSRVTTVRPTSHYTGNATAGGDDSGEESEFL